MHQILLLIVLSRIEITLLFRGRLSSRRLLIVLSRIEIADAREIRRTYEPFNRT